LAVRPLPDKAAQHVPDLHPARAGRNNRVIRGEGSQLFFVVRVSTTARPQEPLASSTGPNIAIWPESIKAL
jgi:hypothetical protein